MFDLPYDARPQSASAAARAFEESGHEDRFRVLPLANYGVSPCLGNDLGGRSAEDAVVRSIQAKTHGAYCLDFVRETVRQVFRRNEIHRQYSDSLDLYLIIGIARDCWSACNPGTAELHSEQFRSFAYVVLGSLADVAQAGLSIKRA